MGHLEIIAIAALVGYLAHLFKPTLDNKNKLAERALDLQERQVAVQEFKAKTEEQVAQRPIPKPEPPPEDVFRSAMLESEPWAREQALKRIWELNNDLGSWDAVRRALQTSGSY